MILSSRFGLLGPRLRRGSALIDVGLGLAIFGLLVIAVWKFYIPVKNRFEDFTFKQSLTALGTAIQGGYEGRSTTGTAALSLARYISDGSLPRDLVSGTTVLSGLSGGGTMTATGNGGDSFFIDAAGVEQDDCLRIVGGSWPRNVDQVGVGTNLFSTPATDDNAVTACTAATQTVRFRWRRQ